jgi:hypothetical protein
MALILRVVKSSSVRSASYMHEREQSRGNTHSMGLTAALDKNGRGRWN